MSALISTSPTQHSEKVAYRLQYEYTVLLAMKLESLY